MIQLFTFLLFFSICFNEEKNIKKKNIYKDKKELVFNNDEDVDKYIEMFVNSFNKLNVHYVDSLNESAVIKEGIKGMMKRLDPYTKLLEGNKKEKYDILKTGKFGGIGIQMGLRRDTLTVLAPMEDSPAYSEGIFSGDQILMVDSTATDGLTISQAADLIKGEVGTIVTLGIYRPFSKERINFELTRDNIVLKHVPYWGIDENKIAYIRLSKFSKNASKDFKNALISFKEKNIKGLVLDLRSNSGGLLSNATTILDYLCERGDVLLSSKGKTNRANKEWKSRRKPLLDIDIPLVVLINKSSASASEIVSGALQDLDRAVIIGRKSFGKGLVQHMWDLNDTTMLKITTSKYYLPSGRLIQKEDYLNNGFLTDGLDKKDSLFTTKGGRQVQGGGGIFPDIKTPIIKKSPYINSLWKEGIFLSFSATYLPFNKHLSIPLEIDSQIINDFKIFLEDYELEYFLPGEAELKKLVKKIKKQSVSINKFSKNVSMNSSNFSFLNELESYFKQLKKVQFSLKENQVWIKNGLLREMSRVLSGEKERIKVSLFEDNDYKKAVDIILDLKQYYSILEL